MHYFCQLNLRRLAIIVSKAILTNYMHIELALHRDIDIGPKYTIYIFVNFLFLGTNSTSGACMAKCNARLS